MKCISIRVVVNTRTKISLGCLRVVKSASLGENAHLTDQASQLTPLQAVDNVGGLGEKIAVMGGNKVG